MTRFVRLVGQSGVALGIILLAACMRTWPAAADSAPQQADPPSLEIYLPRKMPVEGESMLLAAVCVLRCDDAELYRKASQVPMGRCPWPGESLVVDRRTILSRLAACGVPPQDVRFLGAEEVAVHRHDRCIDADEIAQATEAFLRDNPPPGAGCVWHLLAPPAAMRVPASEKYTLTARLGDAAPAGQLKVVAVAVGAAGQELAATELSYRLAYRVRRAVATTDIPAGSPVTLQNARVETVESDQPESPDWHAPFGMTAAQRIAAGTEIRRPLLVVAGPSVVVRRNEPVVMRVAGPGFVVSGVAQALEDGKAGQFIRVRNLDSQRVVVAEVGLDGVVTPVAKR